MSVIQFESVVEGNMIRIPEEYVEIIHSGTKVMVRSDVSSEISPLTFGTQKKLPSIEEFPAVLDTKAWKFNREEANERH